MNLLVLERCLSLQFLYPCLDALRQLTRLPGQALQFVIVFIQGGVNRSEIVGSSSGDGRHIGIQPLDILFNGRYLAARWFGRLNWVEQNRDVPLPRNCCHPLAVVSSAASLTLLQYQHSRGHCDLAVIAPTPAPSGARHRTLGAKTDVVLMKEANPGYGKTVYRHGWTE